VLCCDAVGYVSKNIYYTRHIHNFYSICLRSAECVYVYVWLGSMSVIFLSVSKSDTDADTDSEL